MEKIDLVAENAALKAQLQRSNQRIQELEALTNWYKEQLRLNRQKMFELPLKIVNMRESSN